MLCLTVHPLVFASWGSGSTPPVRQTDRKLSQTFPFTHVHALIHKPEVGNNLSSVEQSDKRALVLETIWFMSMHKFVSAGDSFVFPRVN